MKRLVFNLQGYNFLGWSFARSLARARSNSSNKQFLYSIKQSTDKPHPRVVMQMNLGPAESCRLGRKRPNITYAKNVQTAENLNQWHCNGRSEYNEPFRRAFSARIAQKSRSKFNNAFHKMNSTILSKPLSQLFIQAEGIPTKQTFKSICPSVVWRRFF